MVIIVREVERKPSLAMQCLQEQKKELLDKLRANSRFLREAEENIDMFRKDREELKQKLHLVCQAMHELDRQEEKDAEGRES